ncbi:MAG TPA: polyketide synthase, partial [Rudaea sp.]|nr:polyketide synthase [Rudaea sp.]
MNDKMNGYDNAIAIIGMSCRFPGANSVSQYWRNIAAGECSIRMRSEQELIAAGVDPETARDPEFVPASSHIDEFDLFDAAFFGIASTEATYMDPQRRLLLTCAYEALEQAGYPEGEGRGIVGVYAGASASTYPFPSMLAKLGRFSANDKTLDDTVDLPTILANGKDFVSTSISYRLNLTGPSVNVNTACSTSLVAVHQACRALAAYDCDLALAGGASVFPYNYGYRHREGGILSRDGRCYAFDKRANGTIFGDGVGVVALKRLGDALADRDTIHAVIRGYAVNNDGSDKMSFAAPSVTGQMDVIAEALISSSISAETITYVETHGTGTALGDPIEVEALSQVYGSYTGRRQYCAIGSVKP